MRGAAILALLALAHAGGQEHVPPRVRQVIPEPPVEEETDDEREVRSPVGSPADTARASRWAQLMKRVFDIDVLVCEHCGGRREILAFLTETRVVQKILAHLGLPTEPPAIAPARPPPELESLFA